MHRSTPASTLLRGYTSGGARGVVDQVDDSKFMQEMAGNFMVNETRKGCEAPQNYGFTSVVFDAEKDALGKILAAAEHFTSFIGGSRSFPASIMDDRRHRLFKLDKGDCAMFRGRGDFLQLHLTGDGGFWTAAQNKTLRMQLVQKDSQTNSTQQQQGSGSSGTSTGGASVSTHDGTTGGDGGSSGGQSQQGQQQRGQQSVYKDGQNSPLFVDITKDATRASGKEVHLMLDDQKVYVHVVGGEVYLGGKKGDGTFQKVLTEGGTPSINVYAKVG